MDLNLYLKSWRENVLKISQLEASEKLGVTLNTIKNWEDGISNPQPNLWQILYDVYRFDKERFMQLYMNSYIKDDDIIDTLFLVPEMAKKLVFTPAEMDYLFYQKKAKWNAVPKTYYDDNYLVLEKAAESFYLKSHIFFQALQKEQKVYDFFNEIFQTEELSNSGNIPFSIFNTSTESLIQLAKVENPCFKYFVDFYKECRSLNMDFFLNDELLVSDNISKIEEKDTFVINEIFPSCLVNLLSSANRDGDCFNPWDTENFEDGLCSMAVKFWKYYNLEIRNNAFSKIDEVWLVLTDKGKKLKKWIIDNINDDFVE